MFMRTIPRLILAAATLALVGCASETHTGSKDDPFDRNGKVPSIEASYEMVGVGKPPLSFMITSGGWIKLIDENDNTMLHTAQIPPTSNGLLIKLDPELKALTYSTPDNRSAPQIVQPINPEHRFELYYER